MFWFSGLLVLRGRRWSKGPLPSAELPAWVQCATLKLQLALVLSALVFRVSVFLFVLLCFGLSACSVRRAAGVGERRLAEPSVVRGTAVRSFQGAPCRSPAPPPFHARRSE